VESGNLAPHEANAENERYSQQEAEHDLELRSGKNGLRPRADIATLGLAISLMTSASVALADCFLFSLTHTP
jgi:hypothetical protein